MIFTIAAANAACIVASAVAAAAAAAVVAVAAAPTAAVAAAAFTAARQPQWQQPGIQVEVHYGAQLQCELELGFRGTSVQLGFGLLPNSMHIYV